MVTKPSRGNTPLRYIKQCPNLSGKRNLVWESLGHRQTCIFFYERLAIVNVPDANPLSGETSYLADTPPLSRASVFTFLFLQRSL